MKKILTVLCVLASMLLISSCAKNDATIYYHKLVYEVTSSPAVNMDIRFIYPGSESYMTPGGGSFFSQECPGVTPGWRAFISASAILNPEYSIDSQITIKIYLDDVLVAQTTDPDRAQLEYFVPE